ncbi:hypothetical protein CBL_06787 [Carabus blaptoides fortunei]
MKQFIFVIALATLACATDSPQNAEPSDLQAEPRVFENKIKEKIKALIEQLGDPIKLEDVKLQTENEQIKLDLAMTGTITGISKYEIPKLTLSMVGLKFTFKFVIPKLDVDITSYALTASLNMLPMHGAGTIVASVQELTLEGKGKLGSSGDGLVFLENIDVGLAIGDLKFAITGWLDDEERSKMISELVEKVVPDVLKEYADETRTILSGLIMKLTDGLKIKFP